MKTCCKAVVIGGGIAGCSTLYHLTQEGWTDVILVERDELASGTTWHSAAQVTNFGMNQTMVGLKSHSIRLYQELAQDADDPVAYHYGDGGIRLANTEAQMDGYRHFASMAKGMGVDFEIIDAQECQRRHPLISTDNLIGGLWDPSDGDIDPMQLCAALIRRACRAGAEFHRHTPVVGLVQHADDTWTVQTEKGDIDCDVVINAGGYRVNEIAALMGVQHPVASMEHQYFLTEEIPAVRDAGRRLPLLRCPISDFYCRQDKTGLLVGFYEQQCKTWGLNGIDPHFTNALCPDDIERVADVLEGAMARMPALAQTGIRSIVNGPITYTIDGAPLVGAVPGKRNAYCIVGLRAGLGEGGGHGWLLAQMIVQGDACYDTWCIDPRRFSGYGTVALTALKAVEDYQNEFRFHFPHEHRPAGRPIKTTPLTAVLAAEGAAFDVVNGWERVAYLKPAPDFIEEHSFRFSAVEDVVAEEVAAVHTKCGISEICGFTRLALTGSDVHNFLDRMICGVVPRTAGKVGLGYLLNHQGMLKGEATLANLPDGSVWYGAAAAATVHDMDWLHAHLQPDEDVQITSLTESHTTLILVGPRAPAIMAAACLINGATVAELPWLRLCETHIGIVPAIVMAISFSGERAYEIHVNNAQLHAAYAALRRAGEAHELRLFGSRAVESMRLEKGYLHWKADMLTEFDPYETGLERFVRMEKGDFIGREALQQRQIANPVPKQKLVTLDIASDIAPAHSGASVYSQNKIVGTVTSGARGHRTGRNLAYAFVQHVHAAEGNELAIDIIGTMTPAKVIPRCQFNPDNSRLRS